MASRTVLLVDDDDDLRANLNVFLRSFDVSPIECRNGAEALELLRSLKAESLPQVIFLDLMMPKLNGAELAKKLSIESRPELRNLPVILMSAGREDAALRDLPNVKGFLGKPFDVQNLVDLMEPLLPPV